jgi:hypothetical protein
MAETWPQRMRRISGIYMRWCVIPWLVLMAMLITADVIWRIL